MRTKLPVSYRRMSKEERAQYHREWRKRNRDSHRPKAREYVRAYVKRLHAAVFALLGEQCVRCGFSDKRALQIDHICGGGSQEHNSLHTEGIMRKILNMSHPENQYQILCANCNWIKKDERNENRPRFEERYRYAGGF